MRRPVAARRELIEHEMLFRHGVAVPVGVSSSRSSSARDDERVVSDFSPVGHGEKCGERRPGEFGEEVARKWREKALTAFHSQRAARNRQHQGPLYRSCGRPCLAPLASRTPVMRSFVLIVACCQLRVESVQFCFSPLTAPRHSKYFVQRRHPSLCPPAAARRPATVLIPFAIAIARSSSRSAPLPARPTRSSLSITSNSYTPVRPRYPVSRH